MNSSTIGRTAALALLAAAAVASAVSCSRQDSHQTPSSAPAAPSLDAELDRCRQMGAQGDNDPACRAAWEKNRKHFFGEDQQERRP